MKVGFVVLLPLFFSVRCATATLLSFSLAISLLVVLYLFLSLSCNQKRKKGEERRAEQWRNEGEKVRGLLQPNCNSELSIEKDTVIFFPLVFVLAPETSCRLRDCGVSLVMATPLRGSVPNTRWPGATLTWEELRTSSNSKAASSTPLSPPPPPLPPPPLPPPFVPLPPRPASSPPLPPPIDPARVRQDDSALTRLLHRGVLTGGYINALLGLADGGAGAARIGAPRGSSGKRGGGGGGGNGKGSSSNKGRRRRRRAPAPERLDPHAAAIEHLR